MMITEKSFCFIYIPALIVSLRRHEALKNKHLTKNEVIDIRNKSCRIKIPASIATAIEKSRGEPDIDPDNIWSEWVLRR